MKSLRRCELIMLQLNQILKHTNTSSRRMLWIMVLLMKETNAFVVKVRIIDFSYSHRQSDSYAINRIKKFKQ